MSKYSKVIEILKSENFVPEISTESFKKQTWCFLKWNDGNDECEVFEEDIAIEDENIAWFQTSSRDNHLLRIVQENEKFQWIPKTYNPVFGCTCFLIEWYKRHLLFIYQEKHDIYVCSIIDSKVHMFCIEGGELERKGDVLAYVTYQQRHKDEVRLIELPSLQELEPITKDEARKRGLMPQGLNRPDGFLSRKKQGGKYT